MVPDTQLEAPTNLYIGKADDTLQIIKHGYVWNRARVESCQIFTEQWALERQGDGGVTRRTHGSSGILSLWDIKRCNMSAK